MPQLVVLENAGARLELVPGMGGAIARLDRRLADGRAVPVLRPWNGRVEDGPFALACNVLVPFANRISGGGFMNEGVFHPVASNLKGEPLPIHGDGFLRAWTVGERTATRIVLECADGEIGPFRYRARQIFDLMPDGLVVDLRVKNLGSEALPFGAGFHPWFPRNADTRVAFRADVVWVMDDRHLPLPGRDIADVPELDFRDARLLPDGWINSAYGGWHRAAIIHQNADAASVRLSASGALGHVHLYSPHGQAEFFCLEPVSHPVDAHNLPGCPGLRILKRNEAMQASMTLEWMDGHEFR